MVIFFVVIAVIAFIVGLVCFIIRRSIKKALKGAVNIGDLASVKARLPLLARNAVHKAMSAGTGEISLAIKPFMTKVLVVELVAWLISGICLVVGLSFLILELSLAGILGMDYSREDTEGECTCIAECVYGAKTVDFSKTSYDERALWANGFYLTHDPYNAAAFMNYALYVQSEGAFKSPATDTAKKIIPAEVKWSEGTDYECTFADIMGAEDYPIIAIHFSFGDFDANDRYTFIDYGGVEHAVYINTSFYKYKHETYLQENFPNVPFTITNESEHTYIQNLLDATHVAEVESIASNQATSTTVFGYESVTADDWKEYPEISSVVGEYFCKIYEYVRAHRTEDGTQTDYKTMIGELSAYAKWFYNQEASEGVLSTLSEADYYAYGGQVADASADGGYKFVPAYGNDAVYMNYYEEWTSVHGATDESLADMLYFIMMDNKRCGANTACYLCNSVMAECEGAPWWMDYSGLFRYVENTRVGFEYPEGRASAGGRNVVGDLRPQAQAIAQEMMSPVAYHVRTGCTCGHQWYCVTSGYNSELIPAYFFACCGGGSTATAVLGGLTEPSSVNSGGTVACPEDYTVAFGGANADLTLTYADIPVGSIICGGDHAYPDTVLNLQPGQGLGSDHCTILVYKDETKAYIAGFGGDGPIEDIAEKGWHSSYDINALAKSEVSGRAYIYIYTPNRQAGGSGGSIADVDGYANPTDIESGRVDVSLLNSYGVDVGLRRFDNSWYTRINGWTQADSASKLVTVSTGKTFALYDTPPYNYNDFTNAYFFDLKYAGTDTLSWFKETANLWGITVNNSGLSAWSGYHTDDATGNTYANNSYATTYAQNYTAGADLPYIASHPWGSVYAPGGQPAVDSYWEKYHDVSGMYSSLGYFTEMSNNALVGSSGSYQCPLMMVVQEASTGKVYFMPVGYNDASSHNYPIAAGQTYRRRTNALWATADVNDPNAVLGFEWNIWDAYYWPLCANTDKAAGMVGYERSKSPNISMITEYGCPATYNVSGGNETALVTMYDYIKWMAENRAQNEGAAGASVLYTYFAKMECSTSTKKFLEDSGYNLLGFIECSTQTAQGGASDGYEYDPANPTPMPDSSGGSGGSTNTGGSRYSSFAGGLDCSTPFSATETQGSSQTGTAFSDTYSGRTLAIYTPYGYDSSGSTKYPVAIIKQGLNCGASGDWFTNATKFLDYHISNGTMEPIILVSVQGESSGNSIWLKSNLDGLLTHLESNYNVSSSTKDHIIGGMSMGSIELRETDQSVVSRFGLVYMGSAYLSNEWLSKFSSSPKPTYLCVVTAGSSDASACITSYNAAQTVVPSSEGKLFAQMIQGDTHSTAACMRNFMRICEWYFRK